MTPSLSEMYKAARKKGQKTRRAGNRSVPGSGQWEKMMGKNGKVFFEDKKGREM